MSGKREREDRKKVERKAELADSLSQALDKVLESSKGLQQAQQTHNLNLQVVARIKQEIEGLKETK